MKHAMIAASGAGEYIFAQPATKPEFPNMAMSKGIQSLHLPKRARPFHQHPRPGWDQPFSYFCSSSDLFADFDHLVFFKTRTLAFRGLLHHLMECDAQVGH